MNQRGSDSPSVTTFLVERYWPGIDLATLRSWAGHNLPMHSVPSPDPRDMTLEELAALDCVQPSPARALKIEGRLVMAIERLVVPDGNGNQRNTLYPLQVGFKKHGKSGVEIADWFPELAGCVDELAFVRSMYTTDNDHGAEFQMHTGRHQLDEQQPVLGSWAAYGLGSENKNLPAFCVLLSKLPM
jgi:hypothetical protein